MAQTIFKGFELTTAEKFAALTIDKSILYFVRTAEDKTDGYLYLNGKKYGTGNDLKATIEAIIGEGYDKDNTIAAAIAAIEGRVDDLEAVSADTRLTALEALFEGENSVDAKINAAISAATADTASQIEALDLANTYAGKAATESALTSADTRLQALEGKFEGEESVDAKIAAAKGEAISAATADTASQIEALDLENTYADKAATEGSIASADTRLQALESKFEGDESVDAKIAAAKDAAISAATADTASQIEALDLANTYAAKSYEGKVDTLVGEDEGMSAREIATDEAQKAMASVVSGAPEAFDTLKEIADWIGSGDVEKTTAAQMVTDINNLKAVSADTRLTALEGKFDGENSVDAKIATAKGEAISAATADTASQIEALDLENTYAGKAATESALTSADTRIAALEGKFEGEESVDAKIAAAKGEAISAATADTASQIEALDLENTYADKAATEGSIASADTRLQALESKFEGDESVDAKIAAAKDAAISAATADTASQIEALDLENTYAGKAATESALTSADTRLQALEAKEAKDIKLGDDIMDGEEVLASKDSAVTDVLADIYSKLATMDDSSYDGIVSGDSSVVVEAVEGENKQKVSVKISTADNNALSLSTEEGKEGLFAAIYYDGDDVE